MTSDSNKLKAWRDGVSGREDCLALEALERLAAGASYLLESNRHLASCPHCQAELVMLRNFESSRPSASERKDVEWVVGRLRSTQNVRSSRSGATPPRWRWLLTVPNLAGAAALTLAIGLGLSLYVSSRHAPPLLQLTPSEIQNTRSGDVRLLAPTGDLDRTPEDFRWYAVPLAKSYSIQLLEVDGTLLWSGQSAANVLVASSELKTKIRPGKQLLWKVTALDASGRPIAQSSQFGFRVRLAKGRY